MEPDVEHGEFDAPHRHVPTAYSEPYIEFEVEWVVAYCDCGEALSPRRVAASTSV